MNRRDFMEILATGLIAAGSTTAAQASLAGPVFIPVERDAQGLTPLAGFFVTAITASAPAIDPETDRLTVDGMVDQSLSMRYGDLAAMPQQTQESVLQCVGGSKGYARWEGVPLGRLLEQAGVGKGAKKIVFHAADGYDSSIPIKLAMKPDSLLALRMNDEPLWPRHGWPVRLVLPGKYGYKQVKWIARIEVASRNHKGYWEQRGYSDDATISG